MKLSLFVIALALAGCAAPASHEVPGSAAVEAVPQDMSDGQAEPQTAQHKWLMQAVGTWESVGTMPGSDAPMRSTETVRAIGDYWTVSENDADMFGMPFKGVLTIGYDPKAQRFVGTWLDSTNSHLWHYSGQLDEAGKTLTLETEGPLPWDAQRNGKYRESLEITGPDSKVFTSTVQQDDGTWAEIIRIESRRKG